MEITKLLNKLKTVYTKDIESIINKLYENYDIYDRINKTRLSKDELVYNLLGNCNEQVCCSITKNNTRCTIKSINGTNYCKKHTKINYMYTNTATDIDNNNIYDLESTINSNTNSYINSDKNSDDININPDINPDINSDTNSDNININSNNIKLQFINDSFYYIDDNFIYHKNTLEKVGYIINNSYILSNDPFILDNLII